MTTDDMIPLSDLRPGDAFVSPSGRIETIVSIDGRSVTTDDGIFVRTAFGGGPYLRSSIRFKESQP